MKENLHLIFRCLEISFNYIMNICVHGTNESKFASLLSFVHSDIVRY